MLAMVDGYLCVDVHLGPPEVSSSSDSGLRHGLIVASAMTKEKNWVSIEENQIRNF